MIEIGTMLNPLAVFTNGDADVADGVRGPEAVVEVTSVRSGGGGNHKQTDKRRGEARMRAAVSHQEAPDMPTADTVLIAVDETALIRAEAEAGHDAARGAISSHVNTQIAPAVATEHYGCIARPTGDIADEAVEVHALNVLS